MVRIVISLLNKLLFSVFIITALPFVRVSDLEQAVNPRDNMSAYLLRSNHFLFFKTSFYLDIDNTKVSCLGHRCLMMTLAVSPIRVIALSGLSPSFHVITLLSRLEPVFI